MSTRRADDNAPLRDNRYMSDPDFVEMRGISGSSVAAKAARISEKKRRQLIFFIQSLTIEQRGAHALAADLLKRFPDRLGTLSMHDFGIKPGQRYNSEQVRHVRRELRFAIPDGTGSCGEQTYWKEKFPLREEIDGDEVPSQRGGPSSSIADFYGETDSPRPPQRVVNPKAPTSYPAESFVEICREHVARALPEFLAQLCINPRLKVVAEGETDAVVEIDREELLARWASEVKREDCGPAGLPGFRDIVGALFDYQRHYEEQARQAFAMTSIGGKVFEALDYTLKTGRMVLIEGNSGVGKSEAQKAWCALHRGQARYVKLKGINTKRAFFTALAKPLGVGHTTHMSPERIQGRVESFLEKSGIMLVIDEAQYCWPQGSRINKEPEIINWLNTACANEGIPVALVATQDFTARRQAVETQTGWNSFQLRRRIRQVVPLPAVPTNADLAMVARKLLPHAADAMINYIVGYALTSKGHMQAVVDAIDDARLLAQEAGRERITSADLKRSIEDFRAPSDAAQKRVFAPTAKRGRKHAFTIAADDEPQPGNTTAADLPTSRGRAVANEFPSDESTTTNRLRGHELAET